MTSRGGHTHTLPKIPTTKNVGWERLHFPLPIADLTDSSRLAKLHLGMSAASQGVLKVPGESDPELQSIVFEPGAPNPPRSGSALHFRMDAGVLRGTIVFFVRRS